MTTQQAKPDASALAPRLKINRVAVLGAGVMGAQIAAHLANASVQVLLFDLPGQGNDKSEIARKAIAGLSKINPAPLAVPARAEWIRAANYDEDLALLQTCDLVIEAIAEKLDWKRALYAKIAPHLAPHAILASNTSGLSIASLADVLPAGLADRFCGIHFFNPPRYMTLVELIPAPHTAPDLLDALTSFLVTTVGKGVVRAKDTPNFIANRIGVFSMLATMANATQFGIAFDVVDDLTGTRLGRAKSATFRTADVVGLDTFAHVVETMRTGLPNDPWHALFEIPTWLKTLIASGALGQKTKAGIYKKVGGTITVIDPATGEYGPAEGKAADEVKDILKLKNPAQKLAALRASSHPQAQFLWATFADVFQYISTHLAEIADSAREVDLAVRWGFGWNEGPFELWQAAGWSQVASWLAEDIAAGKTRVNHPLPQWVGVQSGVHSAAGSFSPASGQIHALSTLPVYKRQIVPPRVVGEIQPGMDPGLGRVVFETEAVRASTAEDGVLVLSFKTKMHTVSGAVLDGIGQALDVAEADFRALVIWQDSEPFSAGADLKDMAPAFMSGDFAAIETMIARFQATSQRLRYAQVPTVAAVQGLALGGGCELALHCSQLVAALESYMGLVEIGVGLLPAGGGTKEAALRAAQEAKGGDVLPFLKTYFQNIAMAQVSKSAEEARQLGWLRATDTIVLNPFEVLHIAKQHAIALAESAWRPALPAKFAVAGRSGAATIKGMLVNMQAGGFISEYDYVLASRIADVITGGDVEAGTLVDEAWILRLEREAFIHFLQQGNTQARIFHMLQTGKPLRN